MMKRGDIVVLRGPGWLRPGRVGEITNWGGAGRIVEVRWMDSDEDTAVSWMDSDEDTAVSWWVSCDLRLYLPMGADKVSAPIGKSYW